MKNKLNCLKYGYFPLTYWKNWFSNVGQFFRNLKYAWQRITKGYCDRDIWSLDCYYSDLFYHTLLELSECTHGYPMNLSEDEWNNILKEMAEHFYNSQENDDIPIYKEANDILNKATELLKEEKFEHLDNGCYERKIITQDDEKYQALMKEWNAKLNEAYKFSDEEKSKGFELMSKYFYDLWD